MNYNSNLVLYLRKYALNITLFNLFPYVENFKITVIIQKREWKMLFVFLIVEILIPIGVDFKLFPVEVISIKSELKNR